MNRTPRASKRPIADAARLALASERWHRRTWPRRLRKRGCRRSARLPPPVQARQGRRHRRTPEAMTSVVALTGQSPYNERHTTCLPASRGSSSSRSQAQPAPQHSARARYIVVVGEGEDSGPSPATEPAPFPGNPGRTIRLDVVPFGKMVARSVFKPNELAWMDRGRAHRREPRAVGAGADGTPRSPLPTSSYSPW